MKFFCESILSVLKPFTLAVFARLNDYVYDNYDSEDNEKERDTSPDRRQHNPPRPCDIAREFQGNEQDRQGTKESDPAA